MLAFGARGPDLAQEEHILSITSPATDLGTRQSMAKIMSALSDVLPLERAGIVEIALTEILNNIVEHAYAGASEGEIRLSASCQTTMLRFEICDDGSPMPGLKLPAGQHQNLAVTRDDLPEGGFGWMLIRSAAHQLDYERKGGTSHLFVTFDLSQS